MKNTLVILVMSLFLMSCDNNSSNQGIKGTHDVTGEYLDIRVTTFKNQSSLQSHIRTNKLTKDKVDGLAAWFHPKGNTQQVLRCDIYVVKPSGVKDHDTLQTWGHELAHCIYGTYHIDGER